MKRCLVDTSVWVDHFRNRNDDLVGLLEHGYVFIHPFVVGELACGNMRNRGEILARLGDLPQIIMAEDTEVLDFIKARRLFGKGIGWIDAHLLASSIIEKVHLMTLDKRLARLKAELS